MSTDRNADGTLRNQQRNGSTMNRNTDGSMSTDSNNSGTRAPRADRG